MDIEKIRQFIRESGSNKHVFGKTINLIESTLLDHAVIADTIEPLQVDPKRFQIVLKSYNSTYTLSELPCFMDKKICGYECPISKIANDHRLQLWILPVNGPTVVNLTCCVYSEAVRELIEKQPVENIECVQS